jgi:Holliday junction resolvase RusA-like endonuclease
MYEEADDTELIKSLGYEYTVLGKPLPLSRPRHNTQTNKTYDSQKTEKISIGLQLKVTHSNRKTFSSKLKIMFIFFFSIPSTKRKIIKPGDYHSSTPDIDNLCKMYLDVLQDTEIIKNDSSVCHLTACKLYTNEQPCTKIFIREL